VKRVLVRGVTLALLVMVASGCAAGKAFRQGEQAARQGDWDAAVSYYTRAVQNNPESAEYRIALERAMVNASRHYLDRARILEARQGPEAALRAYRKASEYDPSNRQVVAKVIELERSIRDRAEAARPKPPIERMREQSRRPEPELNPASREPLDLRFTNAQVKDILNFISTASGINVTYDNTFRDAPYSVELQGVTLEEALNQILAANNLFYKVVNDRTIIVVPDTPPKRAQYEEQVIQTFYLSHADAAEMLQLLNAVIRVAQMPVQPMYAANRTANSITVRAGQGVMDIIERVVRANDKPRAEIVIDVEILEVNRNRAKQYGINLSDYSIGAFYAPEGELDAAGSLVNLDTLRAGVSAADFFLALPSALVRFLATDSETRLIAKPQLRGQEGEKLTLNLGDEIPVPTTVFTPFAGGGVNIVPTTSFTYRPVGVNVEMEPRVTYDGDIVMRLLVESSTLGRDVNVAGQNLPSFGSRKVTTRLRLRDGESNLLAGLLREDERRSLRGFPGLIRLPLLRHLFAANDHAAAQTDIVMLLTPRIVRTHELTPEDVGPIHIGTQQNLGLGGPPPLIAPPAQPAQPEGGPPVGQPEGVQPGAAGVPGAPAGAAAPGVPTPPAAAAPGVADPVGVPGATEVAPGTVQIQLTMPGTELQVGGGPYTIPITVAGAQGLSTLALTVTGSPGLVRIVSVQEGSFMRQGGLNTAFVQNIDQGTGRVDISVTRLADNIGASGSGLLAALVVEVLTPGTATMTVSGVGAGPAGGSIPIAQPAPATVVLR
jgi:general secretion pathway protein D